MILNRDIVVAVWFILMRDIRWYDLMMLRGGILIGPHCLHAKHRGQG